FKNLVLDTKFFQNFTRIDGFFDKIVKMHNGYSYYSTMKNASLPDAKFFNKNGNFVDYRLSPSDCNAQVGPFIDNSQNINDLPSDASIQLGEIIKDLVDIHTKNTIELDKNADGYLVLYWAKFIGGKLNRKKSLDWIKVYNESQKKGANIQLIFLNLDYQDFWRITNEDIPEYDF